jgi:UDP-N-acetyl-D-mannosaminuronic acid dehydrogenase
MKILSNELLFSKAAVFGLGYVGLPTAAIFADAGLDVVGVDVKEDAVASVNAGRPHIVEPNLEQLLRSVVGAGKLRATTIAEPADAFLIAVPTPFDDDKHPDMRFVRAAAEAIAPVLRPGNLVVLESTSPVGATELVARWMAALRPDLVFPHMDQAHCQIHVAHCPERILPGKVLHEAVHNERVIGGLTPRCAEVAAAFYGIAVKADCHITDARTAELCKLSENAFRDVNIAFANELSLICDHLDVDVWDLIALANLHPRVNILRPGPGVGGHCIAVDPWFIVASAPEQVRLIRSARAVNDGKPEWVTDQVSSVAGRMEKPVTIACLGLAYKADVDDLRESPSAEVALRLANVGLGDVVACEPMIDALPKSLADAGVKLVDLDVAIAADVIVCLTPHRVFHNIADQLCKHPAVSDVCGLLR